MTTPQWITIGISIASLVIAVTAYLAASSTLARTVALQAASSELLRTYEKLDSGSFGSRIKSIEEALADLATSLKMSKVRRAALDEPARERNRMPDPYTEPDAWRNAMNARDLSAYTPGGKAKT